MSSSSCREPASSSVSFLLNNTREFEIGSALWHRPAESVLGRQVHAPAERLLRELLAPDEKEEILRSYPGLRRDSLRTALVYGADLAKERVLPIPA